MKAARAYLLAATLAVSVAACAHPARPPVMAAPTAKDLPPPDAIPGTFAVRQKLTARSAHGGGSFEAVLQKKPGEVLLVGLTPFGSRAFMLRQTAANVEVTTYLSRELPFPPAYMLVDVHRVLDDLMGPGPADGERSAEVAGELVHERWRAGRLVERTFTRTAQGGIDPPGQVRITYEGQGPAGLAATVRISNGRFGYDLTIETVPLR